MKKNGFTFVELLVVITIIGIVFAAGVVSYSSISKNTRDARRSADLEAIRQGLEMCRAIAGVYPATIYTSVVCDDVDSTVTLRSTPVDPAPCDSRPEYDYVVSGGGYTLSTRCMEGTGQIIVTNP